MRIAAIVFSTIFSLTALVARADDTMANPKYQSWANFKPGSSNTVSADVVRGPNTIHIDVKRTLISITPDEAVIETVTTATAMGQEHTQPATREAVSAKTDKELFKETGEKDVDAMGKTFKCKTYDVVNQDSTGAGKPGAADTGKKAVIYACADVPGGLVELTVSDAMGNEVKFVLTAMEAK